MKFETEYIEKLAKIINEQNLTEVSLEDGDQAITIRKDVIVESANITASAPVQVSSPAPQTVVQNAEEKNSPKTGTVISSPMVGTFYMAPSPDSEPFVTVGKTIKQGDVVCIIEAMKMMNEIKAEVEGRVTEVCVEDGQPVEFGQVLMYVE